MVGTLPNCWIQIVNRDHLTVVQRAGELEGRVARGAHRRVLYNLLVIETRAVPGADDRDARHQLVLNADRSVQIVLALQVRTDRFRWSDAEVLVAAWAVSCAYTPRSARTVELLRLGVGGITTAAG